MPKAVTKLFREPQQAENAIAELKAEGYGGEEVGILMREGEGNDKLAPELAPVATGVSLSGAGPLIAKGVTAAAISGDGDLEPLLSELWDASEETISYYQTGLSLGGIVVSVHGAEARLEQARRLLREAGLTSTACPVESTSPGFAVASKMSETNPVDAPMSGDFRKY